MKRWRLVSPVGARPVSGAIPLSGLRGSLVSPAEMPGPIIEAVVEEASALLDRAVSSRLKHAGLIEVSLCSCAWCCRMRPRQV